MQKVRSARFGRICAGLAGAVLLGGVVLSPALAPVASAKAIVVQPPTSAPMSFADLIEKVSPAVVSVEVVTQLKSAERDSLFERFRGLPGFEDYYNRFGKKNGDGGEGGGNGDNDDSEGAQEGRSLGSGFFISEQGHVVTNNHVVENAREVVVKLKDGRELEADVIGTDPQSDLAVLKVKKPGPYPYVDFATKANPRVGDWIVAVGNPFGLGGTATAGIISAVGRNEVGGAYTDFIQVDAPINRGNSGGPTFDLFGQVIGVNTAIFSTTGGSVGIGFAIDAKSAKPITETLIKQGKVTRGWLGVSIQSITPQVAEALDLKSPKGAIVSDVVKDGPAAKSGIKSGDIIVSVNGDDVADSREVTRRVGGLMAGSQNSFKIIRDGQVKTIPVTVLERPDDPTLKGEGKAAPRRPTAPPAAPDSEAGTKFMGVTTRPLKPAEITAAGLDPADGGLMVNGVDRSSPFHAVQIKAGDLLLKINTKALKTPKDFEDAVNAAKAKGETNVVAAIRRAGATAFIAVKIKPE